MQMQEDHALQKDNIIKFAAFGAVMIITAIFLILHINGKTAASVYDKLYVRSSVFVLAVCIVYSFITRQKNSSDWKKTVISSVMFVIPAILLMVFDSYINFPVWMLGGILIAALIDLNLGLFVSYFYILQAAHLDNDTIKGLIITLVTVSLICVLTRFIKTFTSMLYSMVIVSCVTLVMSLILNKLMIRDSFSTISLNLIIAFLTMIAVTYVCKKFLGESLETEENTPENGITATESTENGFTYLNKLADETNDVSYETEAAVSAVIADSIASPESKNDREKTDIASEDAKKLEDEYKNAVNSLSSKEELNKFTVENSELLLKLKETKKALYLHNVRVSRLAGKCADGMHGINATLVRAASLYNGIGKLEPGDEYENSIKIAKENDFPKELTECLKACSKTSEAPVISGETAIVVITDTVVTTYYYLKSKKTLIYPEKLVDSVIGKEITHGRLNSSGLSIADCSYMREYFVEAINNLEKK